MEHDDIRFTEEALRSQDGKTVPLTAYPGGPIIGEATFKYTEGDKSLKFDAKITDPTVAKQIAVEIASHIFVQERNARN